MPRWSAIRSKHGTTGDDIDFALLVDGLEAEREQGITIDVAYRFFATPKRKFIVADTPGHEQYTRNMATGASTADLAVVLVDARQGVLAQTRRHSIIASLLGIRHVVLAVNKIDLVGFDQAVFERIVADYAAFAAEPRLRLDHADPDVGALWRQRHQALGQDRAGMRARRCSSIWRRSSSTTRSARTAVPLPGAVCEPAQSRLPRLCRHRRLRLGRAGRRGRRRQVRQGRRGSSASSRMAAISPRAVEGQAVTLVLEDEVEVSRGNMLVSPAARPACRRPVRRQHRLVRRARAAARPLLHPAHRDRPGQRHGHRPEIPHRRQQLRA